MLAPATMLLPRGLAGARQEVPVTLGQAESYICRYILIDRQIGPYE